MMTCRTVVYLATTAISPTGESHGASERGAGMWGIDDNKGAHTAGHVLFRRFGTFSR
jgi:hypothetical protein